MTSLKEIWKNAQIFFATLMDNNKLQLVLKKKTNKIILKPINK